MDYNAKTPRATVTIQKTSFQIPQPFEEGHVCTGAEANSLNQTVCENVRNNTAKKVQDGLAAGKSIEDLQVEIDEYVKGYEFGARRAGGRSGDPVRQKGMESAREKVREALKKKGVVLKDIPAAEITAHAEKALEKHPQILERAAAIIAAQNEALEGLEIDA